jgi:uncharacterized membrane protein
LISDEGSSMTRARITPESPGNVAGTLGGAKAKELGAKLLGKDLPAALVEDVVALGIAISGIALLQ